MKLYFIYLLQFDINGDKNVQLTYIVSYRLLAPQSNWIKKSYQGRVCDISKRQVIVLFIKNIILCLTPQKLNVWEHNLSELRSPKTFKYWLQIDVFKIRKEMRHSGRIGFTFCLCFWGVFSPKSDCQKLVLLNSESGLEPKNSTDVN